MKHVRIASADEESISSQWQHADDFMNKRCHDGRVRMRALRLLPMALFLLCAAPTAQIDPRSALIERAAWTALNAGQAHAAAEGFREALEADPKNPRLHLGAGMAASLERRDADARDEFERALALDPRLTPARAMLGQIQYRMGERELARPHVRDAGRDGARRRRCARHARALAAGGRPARSHGAAVGSHFTVSFEGPAESEVAAEALEIARSRVLAHQPAAGQLSGGAHRRRALHQRAVPRHHARALVGRRRLRRHHPRADARRARRPRRNSIECSRTSSPTR